MIRGNAVAAAPRALLLVALTLGACVPLVPAGPVVDGGAPPSAAAIERSRHHSQYRNPRLDDAAWGTAVTLPAPPPLLAPAGAVGAAVDIGPASVADLTGTLSAADGTGTPRALGPAGHPALRVPVLMYHYIGEVPAAEANDKLARDLRVPPSLFAQHLVRLREEGYHTISAPQLWTALRGGAPLPAKPILLTFDDGYADAFTNAFPLLREQGFSGTFFITVNLVGRPGYLTWDQVKAMSDAGMDVQSHAMDHVSMARRVGGALASQLADSRRILSERLGKDVRFFAYPAGEYSDAAIAAVAAAGYDAAFLKGGGALQSAEWAYTLRRSRVTGYLLAKGLLALLASV